VPRFEVYHATLKITLLRNIDYDYFISINIFSFFILLMLSKKNKK